MNETKIDYLQVDKLRPSATNPRKHFDENYIAELSDSILAKGILQPLQVRPDWCIGKTDAEIAKVNGTPPAAAFFEIVAGECRYRGALKVKLLQAPAIVRFLSDQETFEIQLIENLQRSDLTPIEEAQAYRRLIDEMGYTVELIHEKTGKAPVTIWAKLKMLRAPKVLLDAIDKGLVAQQMGELVGSIPIPEMREHAAREILSPTFQAVPMNRRQAEEHVRDNYRRSLSGAQFDQKDASLVPVINDGETGQRIGGGACTDCPMNSGNAPAFASSGGKRANVCLNTKCFAAKASAHFARLQESAAAEGKRILSEEESADVFDDENPGALWYDSQYVKLSGQPDREEVSLGYAGKLPSWKKLLEAVEARPQIVVARDSKGRVVELVDRDLAIEAVNLAAKQKGEESIFAKSSRAQSGSSSAAAGGGETEWQRQDRKNREIAKLNFKITLASMSALMAAIDNKGFAVKGFWDLLIEASIDHAGHDGCWLICKRLGLDPKASNGHTSIEGVQGAALEYGLTLPEEKLKLGYVVELLLSQRAKFSNTGSMGGIGKEVQFAAFAKLYKIDLGKIAEKVRLEVKEKAKPKSNGKVTPGKMHWLRSPKGEFKFNSNGVCAKPATLVLPFPKTSRITVHLHVARAQKGWVVASEVDRGGTGDGCGRSGALPSKSGARDQDVYKTVREALLDEAAVALKSLAQRKVKPAALKLMGVYLKEIASMPIDDGNGATVTTPAAKHVWQKITDNKYRCKGCGAAAVKHEGKLLEEKSVRGKPCSQSETVPAPKKKSKPTKKGLTAKMRRKLATAMKARWAARRKLATAMKARWAARRKAAKGGAK